MPPRSAKFNNERDNARPRTFVGKEDLGEKVTEAEWTLLWLAAEDEDRARRMSPKQRHGKTGMRLHRHLVKIVG